MRTDLECTSEWAQTRFAALANCLSSFFGNARRGFFQTPFGEIRAADGAKLGSGKVQIAPVADVGRWGGGNYFRVLWGTRFADEAEEVSSDGPEPFA